VALGAPEDGLEPGFRRRPLLIRVDVHGHDRA
jgi:hypothetical protein